ncbi:MAG: long-chain fatty acid--CoA ligase [Deltaproteobacteria bacterium]|nr:MAG: long-chain fatty acid--CoA ligase [Deltaproteobacteria bacterium]
MAVNLEPNIPQMIFDRVERFGNQPAFRRKVRRNWQETSWSHLGGWITSVGIGLIEKGFQPEDKVAIYAANCPEWFYIDFAVQAIGGITCPIYKNAGPEEVFYILEHSEANCIFVDTEERLSNVMRFKSRLPDLKIVITLEEGLTYEDTSVLEETPSGQFTPDLLDAPALDYQLVSIKQLMETGEELRFVHHHEFSSRLSDTNRDAVATVVYTSGTTGDPKGVMLTHGSILSVLEATASLLPEEIGVGEETISYLPLSQIAPRIMDYRSFYHGFVVHFLPDERLFQQTLREIQPTVLYTNPFVIERVYQQIHEKIETFPPMTKRFFRWAEKIGRNFYEETVYREGVTSRTRFRRRIAERFVYPKLREQFGTRLKLVVTSGAPLAPEAAAFFFGIGIPVLEFYGLTETSGILTHTSIDSARYGTVGLPIPGTEVIVDDSGEILCRGPNLFRGYDKDPQTTQRVMRGGWFHTGDIGEMDEEGFLRVIGRKEEIFSCADGTLVSPTRIESRIRAHPLIAHAYVYGENRPYLTALLTLDPDAISQFARSENIQFKDIYDLLDNEVIVAYIHTHIVSLNQKLPPQERIKRYQILPEGFSVEAGELTSTYQLRRSVIAERYHDLIEEMYAEDARAAHP